MFRHPIYLDTPYVQTPPRCLDTPLCLDAPIYLDVPYMIGCPQIFRCPHMFRHPHVFRYLPHVCIYPMLPCTGSGGGLGSGRGSRRGWGFSMCGIFTYKQVKFLGKILQHCCGNSFSFLKWLGKGSGLQGGHWIMVYEYR